MSPQIKINFILLLLASTPLSQCTKNDKFNIVLFLAKPEGELNGDETGLKLLGFKEKARVKHCEGGGKGMETDGGGQQQQQFVSAGSECTGLLKASLYSLISYCRNMIGMNTALACAENNTFTNSLRYQRDALRMFQRDYQGYRIYKSLPIYFPSKRHAYFRKNAIITRPEHTEIFKIRSKRNLDKETKKKVAERCCHGESKPSWDFLGVVGTIKMTFFGKLIPEHKTAADQVENAIETVDKEIDNFQHKDKHCLFDLVKDALVNVQESCENGFLLIVIGGNLVEVSDPYSSLIQSVKHIVENTEEPNTIIILTGSCPSDSEKCKNLIPVYVKGPPSTDIISQTNELYNIPYAIKNIIADSNVDGNFFTNMHVKKRSIRELSNNASPFNKSLLIVVILFYVFD